jgi:hypothetical protein
MPRNSLDHAIVRVVGKVVCACGRQLRDYDFRIDVCDVRAICAHCHALLIEIHVDTFGIRERDDAA